MLSNSSRIILFSTLFIYQSVYCNDWLDKLASTIGANLQWDQAVTRNIIDNVLKRDITEEEKYIVKIEKKLEKAEQGFWGALHKKQYQLELPIANSSLNYYLKVVKTLESFNQDIENRVKFIKELNSLYLSQQEVDNLVLQYQKAKSMGTVVKIGTLLRLEQSKVLAKKAKIKSSFFLFD